MNATEHFGRLLDEGAPFALLHRPSVGGDVELLTGPSSVVAGTADLRRMSAEGPVFAALPSAVARERGLEMWPDDAPLVAMQVHHGRDITRAALDEVTRGTSAPVAVGAFEEDDARYARRVGRLVSEEIGHGAGANFVIERRWVGMLSDVAVKSMAALFKNLLASERGAYWTFLFWTGHGFLLGSSPERHISLHDGEVSMSPISGTLRHEREPDVERVRRFLQDAKEDDELCMVLDEELKVVNGLSNGRVAVAGPTLRRMGHVTHTEYRITGDTEASAAEVLRRSLAAPTVIGSPLRNAAAVVTRHEGRGRRYYSGVVALFDGTHDLDSAIVIRTAEVGLDRSITIGVGATVTRSSDPVLEALETSAKAAGLLAVLNGVPVSKESHDSADTEPACAPQEDDLSVETIDRLLRARNERLAPFWFIGSAEPPVPGTPHAHIVDAEDDFTAMLARQLGSLGVSVSTRSWRDDEPGRADLIVLGPGPGDPRDHDDARMSVLRARASHALLDRRPLLAVCLGHQVVASRLGMELRPTAEAGQGRQAVIDHFGERRRVGYYNSFSVHSPVDAFRSTLAGEVRVARNPFDGVVHGLRSARLETFQFHPESILSPDGLTVLRNAVQRLISGAQERAAASAAGRPGAPV